MRRHTLGATLVLVALAIAPLALAQTTTTKPKKKGAKPAASASASATVDAAPAPTPEPPPPPPPPAADDSANTDAPAKKALPETPLEKGWDVSDTREDPSKRYYFFGVRYRGDVIPKFLINAFVDGGATIYSNAVGVELDSRKDGFSTVFNLTLQNYNTGDLLFLQKDKPPTANNFSVINSSLNAIYAAVDLLWSVPLDSEHHWDFEYGIGVGLGIVFGALHDNWVYGGAGGTGPYYYAGPPAQNFQQCPNTTVDPNCTTAAHSNATVAKVGNYSEQAGIVGPKPILFPMINFPDIGIRYKPVKTFEARLGLGFSLTGFWFGISGDYGLEKQEDALTPAKPDKDKDKTDKPDKADPKKDTGSLSPRGML
ncbi:MAG: hypothetical protein ABSE49_14630 [Polyangiaceae bacterium]|jgi:hypothetical protein